jgi:hypothetical protein
MGIQIESAVRRELIQEFQVLDEQQQHGAEPTQLTASAPARGDAA